MTFPEVLNISENSEVEIAIEGADLEAFFAWADQNYFGQRACRRLDGSRPDRIVASPEYRTPDGHGRTRSFAFYDPAVEAFSKAIIGSGLD